MKVKDPVCGMTIEDTEAAGSSSYQGKDYYFCSVFCKDKFEKDPQMFAEKKEAA